MKSAQPYDNQSPEGDPQLQIFGDYAYIYDYLYHDKDYEAECDFLQSLLDRFPHIGVSSLLDMGCGTGGHAIPMAGRGYSVTGVDSSADMISLAGRKAGESSCAGKLTFINADIRGISLKKRFDSAVSMFSVFSYQTSNEDVVSTLNSARRHVKKGGLFVFDFWYGPAVLRERPSVRVKDIAIDGNHIIRSVQPEIFPNENLIRVHYHVLHLREEKLFRDIRETHVMRYFFMPEISLFLSQAGFRLVHACPFGSIDEGFGEDTWNVTAVARAV